MAPELDRIHHVAIAVADIETAIDWYTSRFACDVAYQDDTWGLLTFANTQLALVVEEQHPPHVAVERDDAAKFGELTGHRDGTRSVYLRDDAGNAIEVVAPPIG